MRKITLLFCLIFILSGCATATDHLGYHRFYQLKGEYRLVQRNNDVWIEKLDGSESRQITHTPNIPEYSAVFSEDGKYILYETGEFTSLFGNRLKYYRIPVDGDDSKRTEISNEEAASLVVW